MFELAFSITETEKTKVTGEDSLKDTTISVLNGEYDMALSFSGGDVVVIDIGANLGAFTLWSIRKWKPFAIYSFEPLKANFSQLESNVKEAIKHAKKTTINLINAAVESPHNKLYLTGDNTATCSFVPEDDELKTATYEEVEVVAAKDLPTCSVLKVDTEGCEIAIISEYLKTHDAPNAIIYEYHSESDRLYLDNLLNKNDYKLCRACVNTINLGVFNFIHKKCYRA